jgi:hypothetical protein
MPSKLLMGLQIISVVEEGDSLGRLVFSRNAVLSGYITTLKISRNSTFRAKALRQELVAGIGENARAFILRV